MPRSYLSIAQKIEYAKGGIEAKKKGESLRKYASEECGIHHSQLLRWIRDLPKMEQINRTAAVASLNKGHPSSIKAIGAELVRFVFELREQGMPVSTRMVVLKAGQVDATFRRKKEQTKYGIIRRFLISNRIVVRVKTHESQKHPRETVEEATSFVDRMVPRFAEENKDPHFILNMDQTPIFFSMTPGKTLEKQGSCSVNVRSSSGSTMRVTVAVCITAAGTVLPPLIIFKGKRNGRIVREFPTYPEGAFYACQDRAWMDETVMSEWVDKVLKPYAETSPEGIVPSILLDSYRCHLMATIVNAIQDTGTEVEHIPGGCTGLTQPVDVGIGKPLKNRIRRFWEDYMLETGLQQVLSKPPSRAVMAGWIVESLRSLSTTLVKNSWRHGHYSYFPNEPVNANDEEDGPEFEEEELLEFENEDSNNAMPTAIV